ncbi:hypothetical protein Gpo141_00012474 [Globisporangium polare]
MTMTSVEQQRAAPQAPLTDVGPAPRTAADDPLNHETPSPHRNASSNSSASTSLRGGEHTAVRDESDPLPITTERRKRAKRSRNPARERMQSELKHLRVLSAELEQRLVTLQQQPRKTPDLIQEEERQRALAAWEYVAERQLHERTRVERANALLRAQVQSSLEITKGLQEAVCELPRLHDPASFGGLFELSDAFPRRLCVAAEEVSVYETLISQVGAAFSRMESVFQANGLSAWRKMDAKTLATQSQMKTQRSSQAVDDSTSALFIELIEADVLPFAKDSVFRTMWRCWEQQYMAKNAVLCEFANGDSWKDTVAGEMHFDVSVDGERVPLHIAFVLKWFVADARICYVWRSVSRADDAPFSGACIDETGWAELCAVPANDDAHGVEGTLTISCSHLKSRSRAGISDPEIELDVAAPLASSMISSFEADAVEVSCLMMDLLLEETSAAPMPRAA